MTGNPFRDTALALLEAEEQTNQAGAIRNAMVRGVNAQFLIDLVSVTVAALAVKAEETPRSIYETLFSSCPSDAEWRETLQEWMEAQGQDEES